MPVLLADILAQEEVLENYICLKGDKIMADYFNPDEEFFIIDSEKLGEVKTKLYGFFVCDKGIIENINLSEKNKNEMYGCGVYVYIENDGDHIVIKQDNNASYGVFVFEKDGYFAISNSWQYLVDYIKYRYAISLNRDYANHMFVIELASHALSETMVNEIRILPGNVVVNINIMNKSMSMEQIEYEENKYLPDSEVGLTILDRWFCRWTKVIRCIKEKTNNIIVDLSGGMDSRITFLLALCSGINLNEIRVNSKKSELHTYREDHAIASKITDYYGLRLNDDPFTGDLLRLSLKDIINMCFYNQMTFHKQLIFSFDKFREKRYRIWGAGGETVRSYWTMSPKELKAIFGNSEGKYSKELREEIMASLFTICDSAFRRIADESEIEDMNSEEITQKFYKKGRCRAHFGTITVGEFFINQFDLSPLLDPDLRKLKLCTEECDDKNLLMALIYVRYCPKLLDFPFEGGRSIKENTIELARRINEKRSFRLPELTDEEEFEIVIYDSSLPKNKNERMEIDTPDKYLKNIFRSDRCKRIFCDYFSEELLQIAERHLRYASRHPLYECFPIIAVVKCLMDVQISEGMGRKQAYDYTEYLLPKELPVYSNNKNSWLCELKEKLSGYDRIVIYGAGLYGRLVLDKIYEWHIYKKVKFAISGMPETKEHLGHDIYNISEIRTAKDNYIVVVAVGEHLEKELVDKLNQYHIHSYIKFRDVIRNATD